MRDVDCPAHPAGLRGRILLNLSHGTLSCILEPRIQLAVTDYIALEPRGLDRRLGDGVGISGPRSVQDAH